MTASFHASDSRVPADDSTMSAPSPRDEGVVLRVAVVGAGVSGIAALRALSAAGLEVTVFDSAPDVGGVWSASRAYPGIETQDDARTYGYSDGPMPAQTNGHASGASVREYLQNHLRDDGLEYRVRLQTEVVHAALVEDGGWQVTSRGPDGTAIESFDWLVAANGVFSRPHLPKWPGRQAFEAAGGRVVTPVELSGVPLDDEDVVVVGWGKTACDLAALAAARTPRVHVVARTLTWKYPRRLGVLGLTFRHLVLTRGGERVLHTRYRDARDRVLLRRLPERLPRLVLDRMLARAVDRTLGLTRAGLRPAVESRTSSSLVTEGFFEAVHDGRITVWRDRLVERLEASDDGPVVVLSSGERLAARVLIAATGYEQGLPFLDPAVIAMLRSAGSELALHRGVLAADVPGLALVGWAHNYRSPLNAEVSAAWLAGLLTGTFSLSHRWRRTALNAPLPPAGGTVAGTHQLPQMRFADLDRMLQDLGTPLRRGVRLRQLWSPIDPADYHHMHPLQRATGTGSTDDVQLDSPDQVLAEGSPAL